MPTLSARPADPRTSSRFPAEGPLPLEGACVVVAGLGVTGLWSARFLLARGARVVLSDARAEAQLNPAWCTLLKEQGAVLEAGGHREGTFLGANMIILSPGVPETIAPVEAARRAGIPVLGELELASRFVRFPLIAVTGTNGKSTVTTGVGTLLKQAGNRVFLGGNLGLPLIASLVEERTYDWGVVEVSSFQLDTSRSFSPRISVILNISPDHLDRYPSFDAYVQSKLSIYRNQGPGTFIVLNDDDPVLAAVQPHDGPTVCRYGRNEAPGRCAFLRENGAEIRLPGRLGHGFSLEPSPFLGEHNRLNLLAVILAGLLAGLEPSRVQEALGGMQPLPHRLETVAEIKGVLFVDDSKATNVDAALHAVRSFDRPLILVAGGRHKGTDYAPLAETCRGRVKAAILLGEARELMARALAGVVPVREASSMEEAVALAWQEAREGDVVLLAPACASFDMFSDYAHRGRVFQEAVRRLGHA